MSQLSEIKCPTCEKWSTWTNKIDAKCPYCNSYLDPARYKYQEDLRHTTEMMKQNSYLVIKETDDPIIQMGKQFTNWLRWTTFYGISVIYFVIALMIIVFGLVAL